MTETCGCREGLETCGCCEGVEKLTPQKIANRPGLNALAYRAGTHAAFLETMLARLSDLFIEIEEPIGAGNTLFPLRRLKTRDRDDAAIAWLDSWATVAEVLTFYQERIANEGYLRTATERRSILELARLVGYRLRPGVAATVYLAFELEKNQNVEIPKGVRAQSLPGPGEMPQPFETSHALEARFEWNALKPRLTRPQWISSLNADFIDAIYFKGIATNLKPNDPLLLVFDNRQVPHFVHTVETQAEQARTKVMTRWSTKELITAIQEAVDYFLDPMHSLPQNVKDLLSALRSVTLAELTESLKNALSSLGALLAGVDNGTKVKIESIIITLYKILIRIPTDVTIVSVFEKLKALIPSFLEPPSRQPLRPSERPVSVGLSFSNQSDIGIQLLGVHRLELKKSYEALRNVQITASTQLKSVEAFRMKAAPFGHNVPKKAIIPAGGGAIKYDEWTFGADTLLVPDKQVLNLDKQYNEIKPESWIVVEHVRFLNQRKSIQVKSVQNVSLAAFGISATVTQLALKSDWYNNSWLDTTNSTISLLREVTVYAQSESLELAEEPISEILEGDAIELNGLFDGLKSGRWLLISGERILMDNSESDKVKASELVMLTAATQGPHQLRLENGATIDSPGDKPHTTLYLANSLAYKYKRDTVTINANVAHATQGETRTQVLGSGDSSKVLQEFKLSFSPLTYVSSATANGIQSTLEVRINDVLRREKDGLSELGPRDRHYITRRDNEESTFVIFGNGVRGARLPTGVENVKAVYRQGIGKAGNVAAAQISLLATRPLGVKGVNNPQAATGGADPEDANNGRRNTAVAIKALDRAVSVQDYADFARAFAGIGKTAAARLSDGRREVVHLTIAGDKDIPISRNSDLYRNLQQALFAFGDPHQPLQIDVRELLLIVISAQVKIFPEYLWENVEPRLRATLLDAFGFENRELGQDVLRSEIISVIEKVEGVDYVDIDRMDALSQERIIADLGNLSGIIRQARLNNRIPVELAKVELAEIDPDKHIRPAQLAYLTPAVPDTLILTEIRT